MSARTRRSLILLAEKRSLDLQTMLPLSKPCESPASVMILAEDVEGDMLATWVVNKLRGGLKIAAVKAPGFGDRREA